MGSSVPRGGGGGRAGRARQRNFDTAAQTNQRLFWTTVAQCVLIMGVAVLQVVVLRSFFNNSSSRKGRNI